MVFLTKDFMEKRKIVLAILVAAAFLCALCAQDALARKSEYKLQSTDILSITVHEQPDLNTKTRVTTDGHITFPLLGNVYAEGLTVQELEQKIKDLLEKDYLVHAQVLVFIEGYHPRQFSIMGEVNTPGKYDMPEEEQMTLLEAIAMAGGFTEDAEKNKTTVMRVKDGKKTTIKVRVKDITDKGQKDKDIELEPNDVIIVPESFF